MNYIKTVFVSLLGSLLICLPVTGCSPSQSSINTVVQNIATQSENIVTIATSLQTVLPSFSPSDAAQIQTSLTTIITDANLINTLANQYLSAPSSSLLTQISSTLESLATTDSAALLSALQIKDANSLKIAQAVLAGIAAGVTILSVYLASINVTVSPATKTAIKSLYPKVNKATLVNELNKAKSQGLISQNNTLHSLGF